VWVPKRQGHESDVPLATKFVPDARATHFWDASGLLVHGYDPVLGLGQDAWDVYLLYGPTARWDGPAPPRPDFWMHQINTAAGPRLDPDVFAARALQAVQSLKRH
jgi:hypothetical protein